MKDIIVVEDDTLLNKTLSYSLGNSGYAVDSALTAAAARQLFEQHEYNLFVLDINLPDGSGFDLCHEIKKQYECLLDGTFDYEQLLQGDGIIVVKTADDLIRRLYGLDLKEGDTVQLECHNGISKTYTVMGVISPVQGVVSNFFVLPGEELQSLYPEIQDFTARVNIHAAQDSAQLRQGVYDLMDDPRIQIASVEDLEKTFAASMKTQMEQLYGLLAFIFLFALVNLVNTLITSLLVRQQELGTLQSVGMSNKQLSRMLSFECLIYVALTLAVMLTIGTGCSVLLCRQFSQLGLPLPGGADVGIRSGAVGNSTGFQHCVHAVFPKAVSGR